MIRSYFHPAPDGRLGATELDAALKRLYATGLFKDVKIVSRAGSRVLVTVVENPTIGVISFEGNKKIKDADLTKAVQSKASGPLSRETVQSDVVNIIALYRQHGYYDVHVAPQTIAAQNAGSKATQHSARIDRVNLVFEIKEGDKLAVRQIRFVGNTAFSTTKLKAVVKTGTTNVLSFLLDNDIYDADRIDSDRDLVRRFYLDHGYADVKVSSAASYDTTEKGVVLTFKLDEGPQYRLGKVKIESIMSSVDAAAVRDGMHTQAGDVYDADAVHKSVEDMTMALAKSGQPFATVVAGSERQPGQLIDLIYTIEQGKRLYVERIDIHGNTRTRDDVVRREFDFGEGDPYNLGAGRSRRAPPQGAGLFQVRENHRAAGLGAGPRRARRRAAGAANRQFLYLRRLLHDGRHAGRGLDQRYQRLRHRRYRQGLGHLRPICQRLQSRFQRSMVHGSTRRRRRRSVREPDVCQQQPGLQHADVRGEIFRRHAAERKSRRQLELLDLQSRSLARSVAWNRVTADPASGAGRLLLGVVDRQWRDLFDARQPERSDHRHPRADQQRIRRTGWRGGFRQEYRGRAPLSPDRRRCCRHGARARRLRHALGRPAIAVARRFLRRSAAGARLRPLRFRTARHHAGHDHG